MNFKNIPISCYPAYAWLWNDTITKEEISRQIDEMYENGIRAFYVLGEPENFRPTIRRTYLSPKYMSDEYVELVHFAYLKAKEKGMYTWLYNEGGFPSGMVCGEIREKYPHLAVKKIEIKRVLQKKNTPVDFSDCLAVFNGEKRVFDGEIFDADTTLEVYCAFDDCGDFDSMRSDIASDENCRHFIEFTHERLKRRFGDAMGDDVVYMFDDEAKMGDWSKDIDKIFLDKYGYDIKDFLPFITNIKEPKTTEEYTAVSDYIELCGRLMRKNYFLPMKKWLNDNNMYSIGHLDLDSKVDGVKTIKYGNILETLRLYDVPGIDVIWSQISFPENGVSCPDGVSFFPLLASSAARHNGHNKALSESFAVYGSHLTGEEMRYIINYQAAFGINLFNFMVISYNRKDARCMQYRPNFISENPGMDKLLPINEYTARLSYMLQSGKADVKTALYYPQRTISAGGKIGKEACESYLALGDELLKKNISFDLIDEDFVLSAKLENGCLVGKNVKYESVFNPTPNFNIEKGEVLEALNNAKSEEFCMFLEKHPSLIARKISFKDGSEAMFITNASNETIEEDISFYESKNVYILNLSDGSLTATNQPDGNIFKTGIRLSGGEAIVFYMSGDKVDYTNPPKLSDEIEISDFSTEVYKKLKIEYEKGVSNEIYPSGYSFSYPNGWDKDFSGEVIYKTTLRDIESGDYVLNLGKVCHSARVYVNKKKAGDLMFSPYTLKISGLKSGDVVEIYVSNTASNEAIKTDFYERTDIKDVGPYHENMNKFEKRYTVSGGLFGKVTIRRILECEQ